MSDTTGAFTGADIWSVPEPEEVTVTKSFRGAGRDWCFTISPKAKHHAEYFYAFSSLLAESRNQKESETLHLPPPKPVKVEVKPGGYLGLLRVMAECLVEPKLSFLELAGLGHKIGGPAMDKIRNWVATENGLNQVEIQEEIDEAKNDGSAADSP